MARVINIYMNNRSDVHIAANRNVSNMIKFYDAIANVSLDSKGERTEFDIHTYCTEFFSFDLLDKGFEVIVHYLSHEVILSELLTPAARKWTDKELRPAHNVHKMLLAGAFENPPKE